MYVTSLTARADVTEKSHESWWACAPGLDQRAEVHARPVVLTRIGCTSGSS